MGKRNFKAEFSGAGSARGVGDAPGRSFFRRRPLQSPMRLLNLLVRSEIAGFLPRQVHAADIQIAPLFRQGGSPPNGESGPGPPPRPCRGSRRDPVPVQPVPQRVLYILPQERYNKENRQEAGL